MNKFELSTVNAVQCFNNLLNNDFSNEVFKDETLNKLQSDLVAAFDKAKHLKEYQLDLCFGKDFFDLISACPLFDQYSFNCDDFWRWVALKLIPNIVYQRFCNDRLTADSKALRAHFYSKAVRIYPFTLYYYYKVFDKGDSQKTFEFLNSPCFSTDTIQATIERLGAESFRKDVYVAILDKIRSMDIQPASKAKDMLRCVMRQNTLRANTIIPCFFKNGVDGYVDMLFEKIK